MEDFDFLKNWKKVFTIGFVALLAMNILTSVLAGFFLNRLEDKYKQRSLKSTWLWISGVFLLFVLASLTYIGVQHSKKIE
jgi:uncharacterized membrane protein